MKQDSKNIFKKKILKPKLFINKPAFRNQKLKNKIVMQWTEMISKSSSQLLEG